MVVRAADSVGIWAAAVLAVTYHMRKKKMRRSGSGKLSV